MSIKYFKALKEFKILILAFFPLTFGISSGKHLLLTKFSIFLKSMCLLLAIFLKFIFKKKSVVLIGPKHSGFYFKIIQFFIQKKQVFLENTCSWIFLKSMCVLIAIFLTFIFNKKEKRAFIWPKTFDFLFQKNSSINLFKKELFPKNSCFWISKKKELSNLAKDLKNKNKHELFHRYFFQGFCLLFRNTYLKNHFSVAGLVYFNREASYWSAYFLGKYYSRKYLNVKIPHSKLFQGECLLHGGSTYLLGNMSWRSSYFSVNNHWGVFFSREYLFTVTSAILMNAFITFKFSYCSLIWMSHSRDMNNRINKIHEKL